jgi:hypothetical protein
LKKKTTGVTEEEQKAQAVESSKSKVEGKDEAKRLNTEGTEEPQRSQRREGQR